MRSADRLRNCLLLGGFAIAPCGPPVFDGNLFPSRPSKVGSEESADATSSYLWTDPLAPDNAEFVQRARGSGWEWLRT
jgi:hypothetical protein